MISQCHYALGRALKYLAENSRGGKGGWSDFPTNRSGESTSWVTAYVLWQVGSLLPTAVVDAALKALMGQRQSIGAWGFSEFVPPDCDSTLHVLNAIHALEVRGVDLSEPIKFVLSHQSRYGGFSTYGDGISLERYRGGGKENNYAGWLQPHVCVTAVALGSLSHFPQNVPDGRLKDAVDFLLESQHVDGYWDSYWWRSKYFATARIVERLNSVTDIQVKKASIKGTAWIVQSAHVDGYWSNGYDNQTPCPVTTANCVKALLALDLEFELVVRSVSWMLEQQGDDGSWKGIPALQIPPPHITDPSDFTAWTVGGRGVGSCSLDERRIYTTSTIASAIGNFLWRTENGDRIVEQNPKNNSEYSCRSDFLEEAG